MENIIQNMISDLDAERKVITKKQKELVSGGYIDRNEAFNSMVALIDKQIIELINKAKEYSFINLKEE